MTFNESIHPATHCVFDANTGIKRYKNKNKCEYAFWAQSKAYEVGAAPKVIRRVDAYAYQTAIAETDFFMRNFRAGVFYNTVFPDLHEKLLPILGNNPWKKYGPEAIDLGRNNLGLYQGKVVMIDFV